MGLEPFAEIADYFDSETEGFDPDNDELLIAIDSAAINRAKTRARQALSKGTRDD